MLKAFVIRSADRTISTERIWDRDDVLHLVEPVDHLTTVRFNKFGDLLHFDAALPTDTETACFRIAGHIGLFHGTCVVTGIDSESGLESALIDLDEITDLVRFGSFSPQDWGGWPDREAPDAALIWDRLSPAERRRISRQVLDPSITSVSEARARCIAFIRENLEDYDWGSASKHLDLHRR